jgi:hypothetical protein
VKLNDCQCEDKHSVTEPLDEWYNLTSFPNPDFKKYFKTSIS